MERFMARFAGGIRAALIALAASLAMLAVIMPAGALAATQPGKAAAKNSLEIYNTGDPVYVNPERIRDTTQPATNLATNPELILDNTQPAELQLPAVAPPEVLTREILTLDQNFRSCQGDPACSVQNRLRILSDASNALHEELMRIDRVCMILNYDTCLYPQYTQLQQWYAINDQMKTMMQSVEAAAMTPRENVMILSDKNNPAAQDLNRMAPAAGTPAP